MRRLILLAALVAFVLWRNKRLDEHDRVNRLGAYADVAPLADP